MNTVDWQWKLNEAIDRLKYHYEHIGRKTGYPFLGIVYPPDMERAVLKEWGILRKSLEDEFDFRTIDVMEVTHNVVESVGVDTIVKNIEEPMPGSNPEHELGHMWITAIAREVTANLEETSQDANKSQKRVIVLKRLAASVPGDHAEAAHAHAVEQLKCKPHNTGGGPDPGNFNRETGLQLREQGQGVYVPR